MATKNTPRYPVKDVAARLGLTHDTVLKRAHRMNVRRIGNQYLFSDAEVERLAVIFADPTKRGPHAQHFTANANMGN